MDIRQLTPEFAVSPQLLASDLEDIAAAGFKTIICNRPDAEVGPDLASTTMKAAVEAAGLNWVANEIISGAMTMENVTAQGEMLQNNPGPVLAYCRSGTRSATAWALSQAGKIPTDDIIEAAAKGGYDLAPMRRQIDSLAS